MKHFSKFIRKYAILAFVLTCSSSIADVSIHPRTSSMYYGMPLEVVVRAENLDVDNNVPIYVGSNDIEATIRGTSHQTSTINGKTTQSVDWTFSITSNSFTNILDDIVFKLDTPKKTYTVKCKPINVITPSKYPFFDVSFELNKTNILIKEDFCLNIKMTVDESSQFQNQTLQQQQYFFNNVIGALNNQNIEIDIAKTKSNTSRKYNGTIIEYSVPLYCKSQTFGTKHIFAYPFIANNIQHKGVVYDEVFTCAGPFEFEISLPPSENRPDSFYDIISDDLDASVLINAQECKESDPLELTITLSNLEDISIVQKPNIESITSLTENFTISPEVNKKDISERTVEFKYTIRPKKCGIIDIPTFPLSFFSLNDKQYKTINTLPIPIKVDPKPIVIFKEAEKSTSNQSQNIYPGPIILSHPEVSTVSPLFKTRDIVILLVAPILYLCVLIFSKIHSNKKNISLFFKKKYVLSNTENMIEKASNTQDLMNAISYFLKYKLRVNYKGLTPNDVERILLDKNIDKETTQELKNTLKEVFDNEFNPNSNSSATLQTAKSKIIPLLRKICSVIILLFAFSICDTSLANSLSQQSIDFSIKIANSQIANASTPEAFKNSAALYKKALSINKNNPVLLYNYGTLSALANDFDEAEKALSLYEALYGSTPESNHNLSYIKSKKNPNGDTTDDSSIIRSIFSYHYTLGLCEKKDIFIYSWLAFWCILALYTIKKNKLFSIAITIAILILISSSISIHITNQNIEKNALSMIESQGDTANE